MIVTSTDWCQWCKRLTSTLSDADVQEALEQLVTVRLNAEKDGREAAARFNVEGFPTLTSWTAGAPRWAASPGTWSRVPSSGAPGDPPEGVAEARRCSRTASTAV